MIAKLPTLPLACLALLLAGCPSESNAGGTDAYGETTEATAEDIDKAAQEAADKIDEENADAELEKLKQELGEEE